MPLVSVARVGSVKLLTRSCWTTTPVGFEFAAAAAVVVSTKVRLLNVQSGHIKFLLLKFFRGLERGMLCVISSLEKSGLGSTEMLHIGCNMERVLARAALVIESHSVTRGRRN